MAHAGQFKPGFDSRRNPGGLPAEVRAVMQIFRDQHGPELVELLMAAARSGNVEAIKTGLAYVYGKPKERVEVSGPDDGPIRVDGANLASLTSAELVVLEGMLARLVGDDGSEPTVIPAQ